MKTVAIFADFPISALAGPLTGRGGGQAATWLPQIAQKWSQQNEFDIHWCILDRSAKHPEQIQEWNQTFHRVPATGITASMLLARYPQRIAFRTLIKKIKPHLIHCWGTETLYSSAIQEFNGPSILSMQGVVNAYLKTGKLQGWRWQLFKHWEKLAIRSATLVTSESQWGMDKVAEIDSTAKTTRVEYGVSPSFYDVTWNPHPETPRFVYIGGLNELKGVDILVRMLEEYPPESYEIAFIGDGPLREKLLNLSSPNIHVLGTLKTTELQKELSAAWGLIMPSRADTSPNVVKEARVVGIPIIASPNGGHAEYVDTGADGFIIDSEKPAAWHEGIASLSNDFGKCLQMGTLRKEYFRAYFQPKNTADRFLEIYRNITQSIRKS